MAEVIGNPGRTAIEESLVRFRRMVWLAYAVTLFAGALFGWLLPVRLGSILQSISVPMFLLSLLIGCVLLYKLDGMACRYEKERANWRKGVVGEVLVSEILRDLPNDYVVVNDVSKRLGNIDHLVIGPTGIYVINTKNWRGTVVAGQDGELLWNGKPTRKHEVHNLSCAVMDFHSKIMALCSKDYFIRGLMVFTHTYLAADFGRTKSIHCLRENRVLDYIQNKEFSGRLKSEDIGLVKRAALQLAHMDERFNRA